MTDTAALPAAAVGRTVFAAAPAERGMHAFDALESAVRSYCRSFPTVFATARGAVLTDEDGREYIDFFAGAGALAYGHNPPFLKAKVIEYLQRDGVLHSLDMATEAKRTFLSRFAEVVLRPRGLEYRVQFPGPTGTNAVEAALKLARKVTGRRTVAHFANAFHGVTLGSLAVNGSASRRASAGVPLEHSLALPFDGDPGQGGDLDYLERLLTGENNGFSLPAALIVETVQAEGGVKVASAEWLRGLRELTRRHGVVLIVDDIQVGCGRTGPFFSFEPAGIEPDIVCLSKAIGGIGLPLSLVLLRPELDQWQPGEHNGTFRGNNLAFVAAAEALTLWRDDALTRDVLAKGARVRRRLEEIAARHPRARGAVRGRGLIQGLALGVPGLARAVSRAAFGRGLVIETAGPADEVLKVLPPLTIEPELLDRGLDIVAEALAAALRDDGLAPRPVAAAAVPLSLAD